MHTYTTAVPYFTHKQRSAQIKINEPIEIHKFSGGWFLETRKVKFIGLFYEWEPGVA